MELTYRSVDDGDHEWLWELHVATMKGYVEATYGPWDETKQRAMFDEDILNPRMLVLLRDGDDVGVVLIEEDEAAGVTKVLRVEIKPEVQGHGIGTQLMLDLQARGKPLVLWVMKKNPGAHHLYKNLGFADVASEKPTHHRMQWKP